MSIFSQHGNGKSDKIHRALEEGSINGVILSPKDETVENLRQYVQDLRRDFADATILFDPQFYVSTAVSAREGKLPRYPYHRNELSRADYTISQNIKDYVKDVLDFQASLPLSRLVSPTIIFDDFTDSWSQISLQMAQESIRYHAELDNPPPLIISLAFNENALHSQDGLNEYLDFISLFEAQGYYLIVKRSRGKYTAQIDPQILKNLMFLLHLVYNIFYLYRHHQDFYLGLIYDFPLQSV